MLSEDCDFIYLFISPPPLDSHSLAYTHSVQGAAEYSHRFQLFATEQLHWGSWWLSALLKGILVVFYREGNVLFICIPRHHLPRRFKNMDWKPLRPVPFYSLYTLFIYHVSHLLPQMVLLPSRSQDKSTFLFTFSSIPSSIPPICITLLAPLSPCRLFVLRQYPRLPVHLFPFHTLHLSFSLPFLMFPPMSPSIHQGWSSVPVHPGLPSPLPTQRGNVAPPGPQLALRAQRRPHQPAQRNRVRDQNPALLWWVPGQRQPHVGGANARGRWGYKFLEVGWWMCQRWGLFWKRI